MARFLHRLDNRQRKLSRRRLLMPRLLYAIPATLCLAAAVVTAQAPAGEKPASNPATQQPPPQQPSSTMTGNKITYVGCIKPGASTGTWVLETAEAQKAGATGSGAVGTSGKSTTTLNLDPAATVNLKAHANHKVEIVGTMSTGPGDAAAAEPKGGEAAAGVTGPTDAKGEAPTTAGGPATGGIAAGGTRASGHHFSVESLKMVSATCP